MKTPRTKNRRSAWLNFAMVSAVVVGLSLGVFQLLPESHPMRALRGVSGEQIKRPNRGLCGSTITDRNASSADLRYAH